MVWSAWIKEKPKPGDKITLVCNDGCSAILALATDQGGYGVITLLHAEDGLELCESTTEGALWMPLPDDYPLAFMEADDSP